MLNHYLYLYNDLDNIENYVYAFRNTINNIKSISYTNDKIKITDSTLLIRFAFMTYRETQIMYSNEQYHIIFDNNGSLVTSVYVWDNSLETISLRGGNTNIIIEGVSVISTIGSKIN